MNLPNGCKCSKIAVHPTNWQTAKASLKDKWYISYRFYDASGKRKQVTIRNYLNELTTLEQRRKLVRDLVSQETELLENGLNPITKEYTHQAEIHTSTFLIKALYSSLEKITASKHTRDTIRNVLAFIAEAAKQLRFDHLPISQVRRRHVKLILDKVNKDRVLSATNYNHYRAYLMMLFNELVQLEAVESNPVDKHIPKRKGTRKIKITLTDEERRMIDKHLREKKYTFWRYLHIFFHSGSRTAELFRLKTEDIDLKHQRFKRTVHKGTESREVWTTIKDVALPLWDELIQDARVGQYVFSKNLKPGNQAIHPDQISKRWRKIIKIPFGIKADFYSLKHQNTTETVTLLSAEDAAKMNAHTTLHMVHNVYDLKNEERQHERLKKINNKFA